MPDTQHPQGRKNRNCDGKWLTLADSRIYCGLKSFRQAPIGGSAQRGFQESGKRIDWPKPRGDSPWTFVTLRSPGPE